MNGWMDESRIHPPATQPTNHQSTSSGKYGKLSQIFRELIFRFINWVVVAEVFLFTEHTRQPGEPLFGPTRRWDAMSREVYANGCHRGTCGVRISLFFRGSAMLRRSHGVCSATRTYTLNKTWGWSGWPQGRSEGRVEETIKLESRLERKNDC